jgi:hypothetical protein
VKLQTFLSSVTDRGSDRSSDGSIAIETFARDLSSARREAPRFYPDVKRVAEAAPQVRKRAVG